MKWIANTSNDLPTIAQQLLQQLGDTKIICFDSHMGAGKTTFIKSLCAELGYAGNVNSPSFPIINIYPLANSVIYHIDCYRLRDSDEATNIGMEDCLYSTNYCFIEWSTIIAPILPKEIKRVNITVLENEARVISLEQAVL